MILESGARADGLVTGGPPTTGEETLVIMQSLLCMLREKNVLNRADIEELCHRVEMRASGKDPSLPCSMGSALSASTAMQRITSYLGQRYGGKHGRGIR